VSIRSSSTDAQTSLVDGNFEVKGQIVLPE
jgi:hypothetical protein